MNGQLLNELAMGSLKNMQVLLRHFLAGFVGLFYGFLLAAACPPQPDPFPFDSLSNWLLVPIAIITGAVIYAVHRAAVYPLIWHMLALPLARLRVSLGRLFRERTIPLDFRRWGRRHSQLEQAPAAQVELDSWGAHAMFTYCAGWAGLVIPPVMWCCFKVNNDMPSWWWLPGVALVTFAVMSDASLTARELWLWERPGALLDRPGQE